VSLEGIELKYIYKEVNILLYYRFSLVFVIYNTGSIIRFEESNILGALLLGDTIRIYYIRVNAEALAPCRLYITRPSEVTILYISILVFISLVKEACYEYRNLYRYLWREGRLL
jgi:hypothetical protein